MLPSASHLRTLYQYSGIEAFDLLHYDGSLSVEELRHYGNFGLGCFNGLDGELITIDDKHFHATSDGNLKVANSQSLISCCYITSFNPIYCRQVNHPLPLSSLFEELKSAFFSTRQGQLFYAVRIDGFFKKISLRSVPPQKKPYLAVDEIVKAQSLYEYMGIHATLVGFYFPSYLQGLTYPGFHLHFISKDLKQGGHVLNFLSERAEITVSPIEAYTYILPDYTQSHICS